MQPGQMVINYHDRTKHHFHRLARSAGYLDWANQPDPFRRYAGAPLVLLPLDSGACSPPYHDIFRPDRIDVAARDLQSIGLLFQYALGLSAGKEHGGSRWALRCNPSSGNLHPTEGYLCIDAVAGLDELPAIYHHAPRAHALERRTRFASTVYRDLAERWPAGTFFVALTSIHWREAWKYGERAYRYCQHDVGHAIAAVALSAATLGWTVYDCAALSDVDLAGLLGIDRVSDFAEAEREEPDVLLAIVPGSADQPPHTVRADAIRRIAEGEWTGQANRLSAEHVNWEIIDTVTTACRKPDTPPPPTARRADDATFPPGVDSAAPAREIIFKRRSAVAMDGRTSIPRGVLYAMLCRTLPDYRMPPWSALGPPTTIDLVLFVHRVDDLAPGLYVLVRTPERVDGLRSHMRSDLDWSPPADCPTGLHLFRLLAGDCRVAAAQASCGQEIAGDSAFSLGMLAEFEARLDRHGAWFYRRLYWETGLIGQVLYLEAEAAGVRATGIGCFFDDAVHDLLGLRDHTYQSLYHFTVGGPVEDTRLITRPPYDPVRRER